MHHVTIDWYKRLVPVDIWCQ